MSMATGMAQGLRGTGYRQISSPAINPQQSELLQQLLGSTQKGLGPGLDQLNQMASGGTPEYWQQLEAPALRNFQTQIGNLASRFSGGFGGAGAQSARHSSGFQNALGSQAASLAERLQSQRMTLQQEALQQLLGLSKSLLNPDFSREFLMPQQKETPWWSKLLGGGLPLIGALGGGFLGGPAGASLGSQLGAGLGSAFEGGF